MSDSNHTEVQREKSDIFLFPNNILARKIIFIVAAILCLTPIMSTPLALLLGIILAQLIGHPYLAHNSKSINWLLKVSVVGLGFGMNVDSALKVGKEGLLFTIVSIFATLILGYILGKFLKNEKKTSYLISSGTAICGGSAIAAVAPVIKADEKQISVALGTVFILNSIALFIFPYIGHYLDMSQQQFGMWCAIAIHDTSSVVGAADVFGPEALQVATTIKLARALWIIPLAFVSTMLFKNNGGKIKIPYFIGLFVLAMIANSYIHAVSLLSPSIVTIAKAGLTLTLFLIGAGLSKKVLMSVGVKPLVQGVILWIAISVGSLYAILNLI